MIQIVPILVAGYELYEFITDVIVKIKANSVEVTPKPGATPQAVNASLKQSICGIIGAYSSVMMHPNDVVKSVMKTYYGDKPVYAKYDLKSVTEVTPDAIEYKSEYLPKQDDLYKSWISMIKADGFTSSTLESIITDIKSIQTEESTGSTEKSEIFDAVGDLLLKKLGVPSLTGRIKFNAMMIIKKVIENKQVVSAYANHISTILFQNYDIK